MPDAAKPPITLDVRSNIIQLLNLLWPMVGAAFAGALIGAEREYRGSPAGFRTHILVALSSALLMLGAVHQLQWLSDTPTDIIRIDPARMAHGVLTGIGFLCGGVIFREGISVRGLTTAASLWTTAALGVLFGVGFFPLAAGATLATLIVLAAADLTEWLLPQRSMAELTVRYERSGEDSYSYLVDVITSHGITHSTVSERVTADAHELGTTISWKKSKRERALAARLRVDPKVVSFSLIPK